MGIQASFKAADLKAAGVSIVNGEETHWREGDTSYEVDYVERWSTLTFPDGMIHTVHRTESGNLWVDFNHWGNNRPKLLPQFVALGIPFTEC
jgi:hypothetical protein